jgi:hypothetical protein
MAWKTIHKIMWLNREFSVLNKMLHKKATGLQIMVLITANLPLSNQHNILNNNSAKYYSMMIF